VLVVDDEPLIGVVLRRMLNHHAVTVVTSAAEALALVAAGRTFDVILSDLMMPEKSGQELYEELARTSPPHAERIVFISGGASTPSASAFLARVPNERVQKPFDAKTVREVVQKLIEAAV
jgi:CheY-like chemotaxis protein